MTLQIDSLARNYPSGRGELHVLTDVTMQLDAGESAAVMGPSGCGKSTLLNIVGGLESPTGGTVMLDGENPHALPPRALARFRNRRVGFVFQDHHLLPQCSLLENVLIPTLVEGGPDNAEQRARMLLDRVGLGDRLEHRPAELSGGERQRAAVARALINKPALLLADEPTGNLDEKNAGTIGDLLSELHRDERAILIVVTHSPDLANRFSRQFRLHDGRLDPA